MKNILITRWLLIKPVFWKVMLWMLLPLALTILITSAVNETGEDFRVPVAVVVQGEEGEVTRGILNSLENSEFIRLDKFKENEQNHAIHQLEQYNYDSVFILEEDFEKKMTDNDRDNLVKAHYTDRSLFYVPVKEQLASLMQEYLGELTVYEEVHALRDEYAPEQSISEEEIGNMIENTRTESNLLNRELTFQDTETTSDYDDLLNPWTVWSYLTIMLSVFMFDMINKEYHGNISDRFKFTTMSHKSYLLYGLMIFTAIMLLIDLMTYCIINLMFGTDISLSALILFRIFCNLMGFLLAVSARSPLALYQYGLMVTVFLLALHILIPLAGSGTVTKVYEYLHPVASLTGGTVNLMLFVLLLIIAVWKGCGALVES